MKKAEVKIATVLIQNVFLDALIYLNIIFILIILKFKKKFAYCIIY